MENNSGVAFSLLFSIFLSQKIDFVLTNSADPENMPILLNFISVFIVCDCISKLHMVNPGMETG